jgi:hypothetical protein
MIAFTRTLIDTRFICEYYRYSVGENPKCSIYNALLYFDVINKKKHDKLDGLHDSFVDKQWNVNNMTKDQVSYAIYDVFYLKQFLNNMYKKASRETPDMFKFYTYLVEVVQLVYLSKHHAITSYKTQVDQMNNYFVGKNMRLVDIYNIVITDVVINDIHLDLNILMSINYFRSTLTVILKKIIYSIISLNYEIYEKKNVKMTHKLDNTDLFNLLDTIQLNKIKHMLTLFQSYTNIKIKSINII